MFRICLCGSRSRNGIGEILLTDFSYLGFKHNFFIGITEIIELCCDFVDINTAENSNGREALVDYRGSSDFGIRTLDDPLFKDLAGNERRLRHSADGFPFVTEILRESFSYGAVIVQDNEGDRIFIFETGCKNQV